MLSLTRKVYPGGACGDQNCLIFILPDGRRVRVWLVANPRANRGTVQTLIDAPRDVEIRRGEHLPPLDSQPDGARPATD